MHACRLTRKASASCRIVLRASEAERDMLDQALWTFSATDFLPHARADEPAAVHAPIVVVSNDAQPLPHHQLLINLSMDIPQDFARFERVIELIGRSDAEVSAGRSRWLFYKNRGYPLTHSAIADT